MTVIIGNAAELLIRNAYGFCNVSCNTEAFIAFIYVIKSFRIRRNIYYSSYLIHFGLWIHVFDFFIIHFLFQSHLGNLFKILGNYRFGNVLLFFFHQRIDDTVGSGRNQFSVFVSLNSCKRNQIVVNLSVHNIDSVNRILL